MRLGTPENDATHYVDFNKHYHIRRETIYVLDQDIVAGFRIKTRDAGTYRTHVSFKAEEVEGVATLTVRIEDNPLTPMRCNCHGHLLNCSKPS